MSKTIYLIGAGAAGGSLMSALAAEGYICAGVCDVDSNRARLLAEELGVGWDVGVPGPRRSEADVVIVAVPDGKITEVARASVKEVWKKKNQIWIHLSGVLPASALDPLRPQVGALGAFHPALVFPPERRSPIPAGAGFAVDGDSEAVELATCWAGKLGGRVVRVAPEGRALYHAAMVMGSNYVVALLAQAAKMTEILGISPQEGLGLLTTLASSAVARVAESGFEAGLSGPIQRGDRGTILRHLDALKDAELPIADVLYRSCGEATVELASGDSDDGSARHSLLNDFMRHNK